MHFVLLLSFFSAFSTDLFVQKFLRAQVLLFFLQDADKKLLCCRAIALSNLYFFLIPLSWQSVHLSGNQLQGSSRVSTPLSNSSFHSWQAYNINRQRYPESLQPMVHIPEGN